MINLYKALLAAQREIGAATKDGTNPHFKSSYETLESVIEATKIPLNKAGLVVVHQLLEVESKPMLSTKIIHADSGEYIESLASLLVSKNDMQQLGSSQTYAKRQNLKALTNLPSIDDDGNEASGSQPQQKQNIDLKDYVVTHGRADIKGKKLSELSYDQLSNISTFWRGKNEALSGILKTTVENAETYLKTTQKNEVPKIDTSEKLPL